MPAMTSGTCVPRPDRTYWVRLAALIAGVAAVLTAIFALFSSSSIAATVQHVLVTSSVLGGLAGITVPAVHRRIRSMPWTGQWALTIATLLAVAGAGTVIACGVLQALEHRDASTLMTCVRGDLPLNVLLVGALGIAMTLYETQRARIDTLNLELRTRELERERVDRMAVEAQLASLESRLQPHFLFNTLNTISALIQEDPERAERTVERLAALLRFSLDATARGMVPLADEMKIVGDYLAIEHVRLGDRLAYRLDVSPEVATCAIPPLVVQTLVENSITHAVAPRRAGGEIRVTATATGESLRVSVWDDGPGFSAADVKPGHGLDNLCGRLNARFGTAATMSIAQEDGTRVTILLPRDGRVS
jgi:signal transduction histidine kinase